MCDRARLYSSCASSRSPVAPGDPLPIDVQNLAAKDFYYIGIPGGSAEAFQKGIISTAPQGRDGGSGMQGLSPPPGRGWHVGVSRAVYGPKP